MSSSYYGSSIRLGRIPRRRPNGLDDRAIAVMAVAVGVSCWSASAVVGAVSAVAGSLVAAGVTGHRRVVVASFAVAVISIASLRASAAWASISPDATGPFHGWATVAIDPAPVGAATRAVVTVEGERFEVWARARSEAMRVARWTVGDRVEVTGTRTPLPPERIRRVAWQHVVGQFDVDWSGDVRPGSRLHTATARLRTVIRRGASELPGDDAALLRGIVVGDDADQPPAMVERFRASGLAHLTAVSGQNVAFVLAAAGPVLRRRGAGARWALMIVLIAWFVLLTRLEPSVMRAGAMAALAATAYATGAERTPWRTLLIAVIGLLLIDPLLVASVGFWLSTGATAGVVVAGPPLTRRLHRLGVFAGPLGITLGAQIGVALPSLLVFGRLPLVGIAANVVAVPVAGAVMLYGLPAVIVAGVCPPLGMVVLAPAWAGVWWVDSVATVGARLEPHGAAATVAWCLTALALVGVVVRGAHRGDILDGDERRPPAR